MLSPVHSNVAPEIVQVGDQTHVRFFCEIDGARVEVGHVSLTRFAVQGFAVKLAVHSRDLFASSEGGDNSPIPFPKQKKAK